MNLFEQLEYIQENMPEAWAYLRDSDPREYDTPKTPVYNDDDEVVEWRV